MTPDELTVNEDGSPVLIESVYYRYGSVYVDEHDSVQEAQSFIDGGEDQGEMSSVGVFVEGKPHSCGPWDWHPPVSGGGSSGARDRSLEYMVEQYAKAKGRATTTRPRLGA